MRQAEPEDREVSQRLEALGRGSYQWKLSDLTEEGDVDVGGKKGAGALAGDARDGNGSGSA